MTTSAHNQCTSWCGRSGSNLMKSLQWTHWVSMNASMVKENKKSSLHRVILDLKTSIVLILIYPAPQSAAVTRFHAVILPPLSSGPRFLAAWSFHAAREQWADHEGGIDLSSHNTEAVRQQWITGPVALSGVAQARRGYAGSEHIQPQLTQEPLSAPADFLLHPQALNFTQIGRRHTKLREWP